MAPVQFWLMFVSALGSGPAHGWCQLVCESVWLQLQLMGSSGWSSFAPSGPAGSCFQCVLGSCQLQNQSSVMSASSSAVPAGFRSSHQILLPAPPPSSAAAPGLCGCRVLPLKAPVRLQHQGLVAPAHVQLQVQLMDGASWFVSLFGCSCSSWATLAGARLHLQAQLVPASSVFWTPVGFRTSPE
ncbi:uncharacterized protein LOC127384436 isoform X2 [Apus apus]|uniref:uncharacterized protein LOC127384436 isoform X2 n=1 Tax=Apus apus TaxID=8895 RepID=UPI0021F90D83|nr:uncharacterized protein LOC127384436 isoform X2 [Apus apus]